MSDRGHPYAGMSGLELQAQPERRTLQDSDHLHHRTWRREKCGCRRCAQVQWSLWQNRSTNEALLESVRAALES